MDHPSTTRIGGWLLALSVFSGGGCTTLPPLDPSNRDFASQSRVRKEGGSRSTSDRLSANALADLRRQSRPASLASPKAGTNPVSPTVATNVRSNQIVQTSGVRPAANNRETSLNDEAEELPEVPNSRSVRHAAADDKVPAGRTSPTPGKSLAQRLTIPSELPGADAPPITFDPAHPETVGKLFPQLQPVPAQPVPQAQPGEIAWDLTQLEQFAMANNPQLVQAAADIDSSAGIAWQAGMYPNPTIGYEGDTVNSGGTLNYQGVFINQTIKTAGKLELARMSADVDTLNSRLSLRKTRIDVLTKVRANYYAVLVAQESVRASEALVRFTNEAYRIQVEKLQGGQSAPYEPMQLRALAVQSQGSLRTAQNRYASAWRQLAASLGAPDMNSRPLSGRADSPLPEIQYEATLAHIGENHTDMLTARNKVTQACINVRKEEVVPIPDVGVYTAVQRDFTTPPVLRYTYNLQIGVPVPIFDQNRGGIMSAHALLIRAKKEEDRVRNELTVQLADAYERYQTNRVLVDYYRTQILPDQARAYRGVYENHQEEPDKVGFGDIVVAQQNLLSSINTYLSSLNSAWTAVTDIQALLQMDPDQSVASPAGVDVPPVPAASLHEPQPLAPAEKTATRQKMPTGIQQVNSNGFKGRIIFADKRD